MAAVAIGLRAHSGWTTLVAVGGSPVQPWVLRRERVELGANYPHSAQPYHAAEGLELKKAAALIDRSNVAARTLGSRALRGTIGALKKEGHEAAGCGLLLASARPLPELPQILASHPLIHTADGELFRDALRDAARACGLEVTAVKERDIVERAAAAFAMPASQLKSRLDGLGRTLGPPWRQDEKLASLVAWLSLASRRSSWTNR